MTGGGEADLCSPLPADLPPFSRGLYEYIKGKGSIWRDHLHPRAQDTADKLLEYGFLTYNKDNQEYVYVEKHRA